MSCSKLALCTNAFTKQFLPDLNLTPGRGLVIITKPMKKLQVEGAFHYDQDTITLGILKTAFFSEEEEM
jgi:gamma-glutamylputrescine oxidase